MGDLKCDFEVVGILGFYPEGIWCCNKQDSLSRDPPLGLEGYSMASELEYMELQSLRVFDMTDMVK